MLGSSCISSLFFAASRLKPQTANARNGERSHIKPFRAVNQWGEVDRPEAMSFLFLRNKNRLISHSVSQFGKDERSTAFRRYAIKAACPDTTTLRPGQPTASFDLALTRSAWAKQKRFVLAGSIPARESSYPLYNRRNFFVRLRCPLPTTNPPERTGSERQLCGRLLLFGRSVVVEPSGRIFEVAYLLAVA
jgi:hypothetical protein